MIQNCNGNTTKTLSGYSCNEILLTKEKEPDVVGAPGNEMGIEVNTPDLTPVSTEPS